MDQPQLTHLRPDPAFREFLARASQFVASMPVWKQGNLEASSRATTLVPRPAIDTDQYEVPASVVIRDRAESRE